MLILSPKPYLSIDSINCDWNSLRAVLQCTQLCTILYATPEDICMRQKSSATPELVVQQILSLCTSSCARVRMQQ